MPALQHRRTVPSPLIHAHHTSDHETHHTQISATTHASRRYNILVWVVLGYTVRISEYNSQWSISYTTTAH